MCPIPGNILFVGVIYEWLRRNLNGCKARRRMCCLVQEGGLHLRSDYVPFWHKADLGAALVKQTSGLEYSMSDLPSTAGLNRPMDGAASGRRVYVHRQGELKRGAVG